jgi:hypothetical protein
MTVKEMKPVRSASPAFSLSHKVRLRKAAILNHASKYFEILCSGNLHYRNLTLRHELLRSRLFCTPTDR